MVRTSDRVLRVDSVLRALRWVVCLNAIAVFAQAVYAGQFLAGLEAPVRLHEVSAWVLLGMAVLQLVLSALYRLRHPNHGLTMALSTAGLLLAEGLQVGTGYGRFPAVHVPLGVLIFGGVLCQTIWLFGRGRDSA